MDTDFVPTPNWFYKNLLDSSNIVFTLPTGSTKIYEILLMEFLFPLLASSIKIYGGSFDIAFIPTLTWLHKYL